MTFSSPLFVFVFLPLSVIVYFVLTRLRKTLLARLWLVIASVLFYGVWRLDFVPLLLASIAFNFWIGVRLSSVAVTGSRAGRWLLAFGIVVNLAALGYFKYTMFGARIIERLTGIDLSVGDIILPLGISFFTFTQIAFLVDCYRGSVKDPDPINYALFVTFFPHLIAGPIIHHSEMMPQFASRWRMRPRFRNILFGLCLFAIGLFKKVVIADSFARWSDFGFDGTFDLDFFTAWATALSYTFQIYFDFSGYTDMALGAAMLFNIRLPINFNSPYLALSIQDFWRRWHITLSRYLRDYLYIPLGGNRSGDVRMYANLFLTFTIGGLWHGASAMFLIWGMLHGGAMVVNRLWQRLNRPLPPPIAWTLTFLFLVVTWVFFRAPNWESATRVLSGMVDFGSIRLVSLGPLDGSASNIVVILALALAFFLITRSNSMVLATEAVARRRPWLIMGLFVAALAMIAVRPSPVFLYFNF